MRELALFAGAGGGILGGKLLGWRTVCAVEIDAYCRRVLMQRQNDGVLPAFPIWDDVRTFDGHPWRGRVDVVSGGFPCQDISAAGRGEGITGERSGLWSEFARIIHEVRPRFAFVENSPMLTSRGLGTVLGDLAAMGFDARWGVLGADDAGAPHVRKRIWIMAYADDRRIKRRVQQPERRETPRQLAYPDSLRQLQQEGRQQEIGGRPGSGCKEMADAAHCLYQISALFALPWRHPPPVCAVGRCGQDVHNTLCGRHGTSEEKVRARRNCNEHTGWWTTEPDVGRVANGVASRVDRLKALGNGQVPAVVRLAWRMLTK